MKGYYCDNCQQDVDISDEEEKILTYNNLLVSGKLVRCPYCITETISAPIRNKSLRSVGSGMCGGGLSSSYPNGLTITEKKIYPRKRGED
jgi:DNA-directed RNA polymerase subunit RPC12/RpoP